MISSCCQPTICKKTQYIKLISIPCNCWWIRWYFICPKTNKKVTILYFNQYWFFQSRESLKLLYPKQIEPKKHREWRKILWPNQDEIYELENRIKFPYRNWKPTRKQKKLLKLINNSSFNPISVKQAMFN